MKKLLALLLLVLLFTTANSQTNAELYQKAAGLMADEKFSDAYKIDSLLLTKVSKEDTLYDYVLFDAGACLARQSMKNLFAKKWSECIVYANKYADLYSEHTDFFETQMPGRIFWIYKDLLVANRGLGNTAEFTKYRSKLYKASKEGELPKSLKDNFNFEFFTWNGLNVWGYEHYPELGDPETDGSYSKHIIYVYSTDANGDDKKQLFTLQTVKIHKFDDSMKADFVLTMRKYSKDGTRERSQSVWKSTFTNPVDYDKLHTEVVRFLEEDVKPQLEDLLKESEE